MISSMSGGLQINAMPADEQTMERENQQLKRDLEFATSEIERLRAKLVIMDDT